MGLSTCDNYTSALGGGQKVLSYSYYTPPGNTGNTGNTGKSGNIYRQLMETLANTSQAYYKGWR